MTFDALHAALLLLAAGAAVTAAVSYLRARRLAAEIAIHDGGAERLARNLALVARDMNGIGLALLGRAQHLGQQAGRAFEGEARQLLALADAAAQEGAGTNPRRHLVDQRFALAPVLQEAVAIAGAQLGPGTRHWRIAPDIESLIVTADRRALLGAVVQVLSRAARATREGDFIDIRADLRPHAASIVVEDEGLGLAIGDLEPALHDGAPERTRGLGFGLALARSLLCAHGGELVIEAAPGIGTRAFLSLPPERVTTLDQVIA